MAGNLTSIWELEVGDTIVYSVAGMSQKFTVVGKDRALCHVYIIDSGGLKNTLYENDIHYITREDKIDVQSYKMNTGCWYHEYVNVGFNTITMACKHCGQSKPQDIQVHFEEEII